MLTSSIFNEIEWETRKQKENNAERRKGKWKKRVLTINTAKQSKTDSIAK
jgi:hypothetical protein